MSRSENINWQLGGVSLPALQADLDALAGGQSYSLSQGECDRLFGTDDASAGRMRNFAVMHRCYVVHRTPGQITFAKLPTND